MPPAPEALLAQLIDRLRAAGMAPDAEGLSDALWLAQWMDAADEDGRDTGTGGERRFPATIGDRRQGGREQEQDRGQQRTGRDPSGPPADGSRERPLPVHAVRPSDTPASEDGTQIRVPVATAFPGLLPLERALRPLQRYRPRTAGPRGPLDEAATAERSARAGHILPVFGEVRRKQAALLLVMDDSPSMVVWDRMLDELRLVCEQVGAFRDVAVHYLRPGPDGEAGVAAAPGGEPLASADRLRDPTGRTVTLLLSDCSGALWRGGAAQRLLHRFARTGPVAVVQPLPQRMWPRTLLPAEPGMLRGREEAGGRLEFTPRRRRGTVREPGSLAVPVLAPTEAGLGAWARTVSGTARSWVDACAAWVHGRHPGAEPQPRQRRSAEELLREFQAVSSPAAQHLAAFLSAAPLTYRVMQLVQRAMMPQTGPVEMAEVLLSGLLVPADEPSDEPSGGQSEDQRRDGGPWYEFAPGVQDGLLRRLSLGEASLVLKHCSLYIERVFGRRARNFPAMAVGYLSGSSARTGGEATRTAQVPVPRAFAEVARKVLLRFQPGGVGPVAEEFGSDGRGFRVVDGTGSPPSGGVVIEHPGRVAERARERLERFQRQGTIRDLWEAIRLLRSVPADERRPERFLLLRTLLAECLLSLWKARQDDDVLAEAERTARGAVELAVQAQADSDASRAHFVLGCVLQAMARQDPGPRALDEAAAHLDRAFALLRGAPGPGPLLDVALRSAEIAGERYGRTLDRTVLQEAQARLDTTIASWPYADVFPEEAWLARGGLLLALAQDARTREAADEARSLALRAVADFETVAGSPPDQAAGLCRVLLQLAEAREAAAGDPGAPEAVAELRRALEAAAGVPERELELDCLRRLARAYAARYAHTGDTAELAEADAALAGAQRLVQIDDPVRAEVLAERGRVLVEWAQQGGGIAVATDGVRVLREALAQTPESAPRLAERRLLFGRALRQRRASGGAPTDLHEAEWILARAARGAADPRISAQAWLELGQVLRELAQDPGAAQRRDDAAESFRRAAEDAVRAGDMLLAAQSHHLRGAVLELTAGPARALESYRAAWELWQRSGAAGGPQARSTRERMLALEATA
ncbi:hypothetical protein NGB36_06920 [Streptomyces sp. RB6PN25]|uniref:Metallophosphoesterase n=1 Tax=Streptomyces humicola TaxID=2953240 RepID=A0ABT1PRN7_9ACTN|nr:SAV_2336 N-terminal domain-related protein [Streptomyces humicola]MCQ4080334.1 hypothetical protein [Streptomyces humicola]